MKTKSVFISKRFVPEWNGNKDLPAHEQMVLQFRRIPSTAEKKNYVSISSDAKGKFELNYNDVSLVAAFVEKVENYENEDSEGTVKKITTGAELADLNNSLLDGLFTEIRSYLFPDTEELNTGESKA